MTADQIQQLKQEVVSLQKQVDGANAGPPVYVGQYLLTRLEQLGVSVRIIYWILCRQSHNEDPVRKYSAFQEIST